MTRETDGGVFCSLVIPCYNEAGNLAALLEEFAAARPAADFELILVDNGSSDGTAEQLRRLLPRFPFARAVTVPVNQGYGYGISRGLEAARGLYAGWAHGDLQYIPAEILAAVESLRSAGGGRLFLKGLRSSRTFADTFFTAGMSLYESLLFGTGLRDINAQPTLFHRSLLEHWAAAPRDFLLDLYACVAAARSGFRVLRVPMRLRERARGASSWNRGLSSRLGLALRSIKGSVALRRAMGADPGRYFC
ncbi:MAG: hypothetical protein A2016_04170 [Elusimicrobia bacterium GWF2_62_30]|nr:MAG: hypothetical protein A2016_04170 [Elusimicrobia bacterium GWF2_62_30]